MTERCQTCEKLLSPDSPQGLCPTCLLTRAIGSPVESSFDRPWAKDKSPDIEELTQAFDDFEIEAPIGQGSMGAVYRARQVKSGRVVALKILSADLATDAEFAERFLREGKTLARLHHPHIVKVYESGKRSGFFYLVMEFVDGPNLRGLIQSQRFQTSEVVSLLPQLCEALQYAHDEGVVHRDIKPENILIDELGQVKVADFGLAKLSQSKELVSITGTGRVMGTPHYMAPEQIERPDTVDHRADIYALGVVTYELLTGELPLGRFPLPSENHKVSKKFDAIVLKALQKSPDQRYHKVAELLQELREIRETGYDSSLLRGEDQALLMSSGQASLCRHTLLGALSLPFVLFTFLAVFTLKVSDSDSPQSGFQWLPLVLAIGGILSPVMTTGFGLSGASRIFKSKGRLYGLTLATILSLFYPIICLDGIFLGLFMAVKGQAEYWNFLLLVWILGIVALDVFLVAKALQSTRSRGRSWLFPVGIIFIALYSLLALLSTFSFITFTRVQSSAHEEQLRRLEEVQAEQRAEEAERLRENLSRKKRAAKKASSEKKASEKR